MRHPTDSRRAAPVNASFNVLFAEQARPPFALVEGTEGELRAHLVLLAMGFLHPEQTRSASPRGTPRARFT